MGEPWSDIFWYGPDAGKLERWHGSRWEEIGNPNNHGHLRFSHERKTVQVHRFVWEMVNGTIPAGMQIDHINRVKADNRLANLRLATHAQNSTNQVQPRTKPFRGVFLIQKKYWAARIQVNGKTVELGRFKSPDAAAQAYDASAKKLHGEFAVVNFPVTP